jgi:hypothetical protein
LKKKIDVNGLNNNVKVNNELVFIQTIMNTKIGRRKLTPTIDSIMKANKQRFAMASSYNRIWEGNYGNQVAKGIGLVF